MEDYGLVSIIMPSWACGEFIEESIRSVQAQTYRNWELLIQDDCSNDNTKEAVEKLRSENPELFDKIKYECNPKNSGAAITRNNALRRAKGRWIAFLDSDDLWDNTKLEKQLDFMVSNKYNFTYHNVRSMNEDGSRILKVATGPKSIGKIGMYNYDWIGCTAAMYNAEHVGLVQIEDIKKNNDYAIWLKVIQKANCYLLDETLSSYRVRKGSISRHSKTSLIIWHYKLFREAEHQNVFAATINTFRNLFFGVLKKLMYEHNIK